MSIIRGLNVARCTDPEQDDRFATLQSNDLESRATAVHYAGEGTYGVPQICEEVLIHGFGIVASGMILGELAAY